MKKIVLKFLLLKKKSGPGLAQLKISIRSIGANLL